MHIEKHRSAKYLRRIRLMSPIMSAFQENFNPSNYYWVNNFSVLQWKIKAWGFYFERLIIRMHPNHPHQSSYSCMRTTKSFRRIRNNALIEISLRYHIMIAIKRVRDEKLFQFTAFMMRAISWEKCLESYACYYFNSEFSNSFCMPAPVAMMEISCSISIAMKAMLPSISEKAIEIFLY